ncbi:hypothetical protein ATANTOWER_031850 [Ataeniobius toweri]|uniref:Uncharacterized protein n=1 Tax=Ataeniobius toweri TaxID=208326 RepID=A0ABU7A9I4_9TELE|nr:hypothetical protein [Ataeniobius toweri]
MKIITGFKQDDQTDECLDKANELNTFFNRFSSETSSASSSPAHNQSDIPPSFDPQLSCQTSNVLSFTSATDPSASTCLPSTKSEDADAPLASPFHLYVSRSQVKRQLERLRKRMLVQIVSAPESWRPVQSSAVGYCSTSSTLAWPRRRFQC